MVDIAPQQRTVSAEWHGIAEIAVQIRSLFKARREAVPTREMVITRLGDLIEVVDTALTRGARFQTEATELEQRASSIDPVVVPTFDAVGVLQVIVEVRESPKDQETVLTAYREQMMDLMIQVNPEDAWIYERENLASLHQAQADADAGLGTFYESGDEFLAALEARVG